MAEPGYREWSPSTAGLTRHVRCSWAGRLGGGGEPFAASVLPDGCTDLIWDGTQLLVAGPDTGPVPIDGSPGAFFVGVRFRPGMARGVLGLPISELLDQRVDASAVLGARAGELAERLGGARSLYDAALVLESAVLGWLADAAPPDRRVEGAVTMLDRPLTEIASQVGLSERQLHRRCTAEIGYGLKTLERIVRFRRFLALAERSPDAGLAQLAVDAGYADQPHLTRECRRLAGLPPASLLARPIRSRP